MIIIYLIPKNIKVKREIFKGFGLLEIVFMAISIGVGYIFSLIIEQYKIKIFVFAFFPMLTFMLLFPLPNGNTLFNILKKYLKYKIKQNKYKIKNTGGISNK